MAALSAPARLLAASALPLLFGVSQALGKESHAFRYDKEDIKRGVSEMKSAAGTPVPPAVAVVFEEPEAEPVDEGFSPSLRFGPRPFYAGLKVKRTVAISWGALTEKEIKPPRFVRVIYILDPCLDVPQKARAALSRSLEKDLEGVLSETARRPIKTRQSLTDRIYEVVDRHSKGLAARDASCPI